ncbi:phospholipid scramblase 1 [Modicella reniformis]|uniref:Phospholipid scramblase 1 n=1 Tax=Modicella reniformis TaxID=1440133 RepID=A0A9P6MBB8_9FUNG|nr:phospholipid scramblase 1 [Modicella reniformis]
MSQFTQEQLTEFQSIFNNFDKDNDGSISRTELPSFLALVGNKIKNNALDQYLETYDKDKSGTISFDEFVVLADKLIKNKTQTK